MTTEPAFPAYPAGFVMADGRGRVPLQKHAARPKLHYAVYTTPEGDILLRPVRGPVGLAPLGAAMAAHPAGGAA